MDIRDNEATKIIRQGLESKTDYLSLLINNAGLAGTAHNIELISCDEVKELFDVHCCGTIRCFQAVIPYLRKAEGATIVNVNSRLGSIGNVSSGKFDHITVSYGMRMAKAAQNMLISGFKTSSKARWRRYTKSSKCSHIIEYAPLFRFSYALPSNLTWGFETTSSASLYREIKNTGISVFSVHPGRILTRMGSPDADMLPEAAAIRFISWLEKIRQERKFGYFDALGEELPF